MRDIYGFLQLVSRLANRPFGHPSQVRTQVLVLQTCVYLRQLASPFGQGLKQSELVECKQRKEHGDTAKNTLNVFAYPSIPISRTLMILAIFLVAIVFV